MALLIEELKIWQETGREKRSDMQQREPGSAAEPRHMGRALYPLS